jgi:hypothetical protein
MWTNRGYAAISIAVEGQTDGTNPPTMGTGWHQHAMAGPGRNGIYGDSNVEPITDQWMYHAVGGTVLANSLMRSLPQVDASRVGLMGISWGGVITATAMGVDDRFAFAIPVYGAGHKYDIPNQHEVALEHNFLYRQVWDPMVRMSNAAMPALWFSWPQENNYSLDSQAASYYAAPGVRMVSLIPDLGHGHAAAWNPGDSYAFADSVVSNGTPWCVQTNWSLAGGTAVVHFVSSKILDRAELISTTDSGFTGDFLWTTNAATVVSNGGGSWTVSAVLPADTTAWFLNALNGALVASSDYRENIALMLTPGGGLDIGHALSDEASTGVVSVAYTGPSYVEIVDLRIHGETHPGAFSFSQTQPWILKTPWPVSEPLEVRFDNTVAGLVEGQNSTGLLTVVWQELDGATNRVDLALYAGIPLTPAGAYGTWAAGYGLDLASLNTDAVLNTLGVRGSGRLLRDDFVFTRSGVGAWTLTNGVIANASAANNNVGEGAMGRMVDLSAFGNLNTNRLTLQFDYTTADPAERLYVHLWGYVDVSSGSSTPVMNLAAQDGNAWESSGGALTPYNLGKPDGVFLPVRGRGDDAAAILTGSTGEQTYSNTFDLSGFVTAPDTVAGYDYLALGFAREVGPASTPEVTIRNVVLSVPGEGPLIAFLQHPPLDDPTHDPDGDGAVNLAEYAHGGNPTNGIDIDVFPVYTIRSNVLVGVIYRRRLDYAARGLTYEVERSTNLISGVWSTNLTLETGSVPIDGEFESVTNVVDFTENRIYIQFRIGYQE